MISEKLFDEIKNNIKDVIQRQSVLGKLLWEELLKAHPADLAKFLGSLPEDDFKKLYIDFPSNLSCAVFREFSEPLQALALTTLNDSGRVDALGCLTTDELTDLFERLSDEELKQYLSLLHKTDREKVLSLLKFNPESAGGIMDTDVLALHDDLSVQKSIQLLQRLEVNQEIHRQIFVIDKNKRLMGHICLEDLVLQKPQARLSDFMRKNLLVAKAEDDREEIANKMVHYNMTIIPVVGEEDYFLGVIPSSTLIDIIEEESAENVYRMAAMTPVKGTYFDASIMKLLYQRSMILGALLLAQSLSSAIIKAHETLLITFAGGVLMQFLTMLTSTGGNASSQTSAVVIQGIASGEINKTNIKKFLKREFFLAFWIAFFLGFISFLRVYITSHHLLGSIAVSSSLVVIVMASIMIGSCIPIVLRRINVDPAYSAGPVLATLMDILGLLIYCRVSQQIFTYFETFS